MEQSEGGFVMGSPLIYLIAGIAFLAALTGAYYKIHHDGYEQGLQEVTVKWQAANAAAEKQAREKEVLDKQAKEKADAENQKAVSDLNATIGKLRADANKRRTNFLPATPTATASSDTACFNRPEYLGAYGSLVEGLRGLADEGSKAVTDLNTAKTWAKNR